MNALDLIATRFSKRTYYTWADLVLISLNPFTKSDEETRKDKVLKEFLKTEPCGKKLEPHIYSIVYRAYRALSYNRMDQVVLIIGDSGSGKTYSMQKALEFLAKENKPLGDIRFSLTLLSAFGNAGTECHGDSSRFGKLLLLGYNEYSDEIISATLHTYLLEKTRVSSPTVKNFHIFYQILSTYVVSEKYSLFLKADAEYKILPGKSIKRDTSQAFGDTLEALRCLKFDSKSVGGILSVVAAILHLGNIDFTASEGKFMVDSFSDESALALQYASDLLGLDPEVIQLLLTHNIIAPDSSKSGRQCTVYEVPVATLADAFARRDALMKTLYVYLFNWIVLTINKTFNTDCTKKPSLQLGLLDIYGFETLPKNSLEQLCINYANERLHSFFVQDFLLQKKTTLVNEGLLPQNVPKLEEQFIKDVNYRISMLDAPFSVMGIINESSLLGRHLNGNDLCSRLSTLPKTKFIVTVNNEHKFRFSHFAGCVKYDARSMVEKNTDKVPNEIINTLCMSGKDFIVNIIKANKTEDPNTSRNNTVLSKFKNSLDSLMRKLKSSQVHYVRCIKPNSTMKQGHIEKHFLFSQLQSSGLLEAVKLCGHCYPIKLAFTEFFEHFYKLIGVFSNYNHQFCNMKFQRTVILKWMGDIGVSCQVAEKYVFLREDVFTLLEAKAQFLRKHSAIVIQKYWRNYIFQKRYKAARIIQQYMRKWTLMKHLQLKDNPQYSNTDASSVLILKKYDSDFHFSASGTVTLSSPSRTFTSSHLSFPNAGYLEDRQVSDEYLAKSKVNVLQSTEYRQVSDEYLAKSKVNVLQSTELSLVLKVSSQKSTVHSESDYSILMSNKVNLGKATKEGKLELMMDWLDKIPVVNDPFCSKSEVKMIKLYQKPLAMIKEGNCSKYDENTASKRNFRLQSELYTIGNVSYPKYESGYSCHYLKKIIVTEKVIDNITYFIGNGVVSKRALSQVPIWFHTRMTCFGFSPILPFNELPKGIMDALK